MAHSANRTTFFLISCLPFLTLCSLPHALCDFSANHLPAHAGTLGGTVGPIRRVGSQCGAIEILTLQGKFISKRLEEREVAGQPPINCLGQILIVGVRGLVAIGQHGQPLPFVHDPRGFECER